MNFMDYELSLEARIFLSKLYRTYLFRRDRGVSKAAARVFNHLVEDYQLEMPADVLHDVCEELSQAGLMCVSFVDVFPDCAALYRQTITYMERKAGRTIPEAIRYLLELCAQQQPKQPSPDPEPPRVRTIPFDEEAFYSCLGNEE